MPGQGPGASRHPAARLSPASLGAGRVAVWRVGHARGVQCPEDVGERRAGGAFPPPPRLGNEQDERKQQALLTHSRSRRQRGTEDGRRVDGE